MRYGRRLLPLFAALVSLAACSGLLSQQWSAQGDTSGPRPTVTPAVLLPGTPAMPLGGSGLLSPAAHRVVPILMYHQIRDLPGDATTDNLTWTVSPASLAEQLGYLAAHGYSSISLDQLLDGYEGRAGLPEKPVVLTFDDGWKSQFVNALPLLKRYSQTATFYVMSTHMGYGAYFDWAMTEELRNAGMTIGSHTLDHADLSLLTMLQVNRQLRESKVELERRLRQPVHHFAYPYGAYTDEVVNAVSRAGYRSAVTLTPAPVKYPVSPLQLPRVRVSYKETLADFVQKLP